jgi:hypothetical protein
METKDASNLLFQKKHLLSHLPFRGAESMLDAPLLHIA